MLGLVFSVVALCVRFEAVMVWLGAVLKVTTNDWLPPTSAALAGSTAFVSLEKIRIVSLVLIWFQFASTALTVIENAEPAVSVLGVPVFPLALPGFGVSPGTSNCNFVNT